MSEELQTETKSDVSPVQEAWQEFMRKCAEIGQIDYTIDMNVKQKEELEIKRHNAKVDLKKLADKYNDLMTKQPPAQVDKTPETVQ